SGKGAGQECKIPDSERAVQGAIQNDGVGAVVAGRRQQRQESTGEGTADGQRSVLCVEPLEEIPRAFGEVIAEPEYLYFLRTGVARSQQPEVIKFPAFRGPAIEKRIGQHRELRLAEKCGNDGRDQKNQKPRREVD